MELAYFGLPLGALLLLADGHQIGLCVVSPIPAPGRRRLRRLLGERVIEARAREPLDDAVDAKLLADDLELLVSWFWTRRLPKRWLDHARLGGVGVHPSLLPRHRGADPYFWAIDTGDLESGVTLHQLAPDYDTGAQLLQRALPVAGRDAWQLARALDRPSLELLRLGVARSLHGPPLTPQAQDESRVTLAPEPTGDLLRVDWSWSTERVLRRLRALSPVPGLALEVRGVPFFATRGRPHRSFIESLLPGEAMLAAGPPLALVVRTGDGAIMIDRARVEHDAHERTLNGPELAQLVENGPLVLDCGSSGGD